jgi:homoserine O-acetyltransferase/O-succinyltransferase
MEFVEKSCVLRNFEFASKERMPELKIGYRTLGKPKRENGSTINAVLMLHGTTGSGQQFTEPSTADFLFGKGQPLDADKYFIILPDAIGHGTSSKPSDGLRSSFPRYCYGDIVRAQYRLVSEELAISRLLLIIGTSMGGMQTWMWASQFPEMMQAAIPIASLPEKVSGRNLLWRRMLIDMIRSDPGYCNGQYKSQPAGLATAWELFNLMADSPFHLKEAFDGPDSADRQIKDVKARALQTEDANDVVWEFDASRDYNPSPEKVAAPLLAVNFADDEINPEELGVLQSVIRKVKRGQAVTVPVEPKSRGHQSLRVAEIWAPYVQRFMEETFGR